MPLAIRPVEAADRDRLLALSARLTVGVAQWRDAAAVARAVRGWVESSVDAAGRPDRAVLVAELDGVVVGFASVGERVHFSGEVDAYLGELVVDDAAGRQGVGRRLVAAAEAWAAGRGLGRMSLDTGAANHDARRFYAALGYLGEDVRLSRALPADAHAEQRSYWDGEAASFDDEPDHGLRDDATRARWRDLLVAHLPQAPADVVDLGCGTGTLSLLLAEVGHRVHGVDLSPAMVERARVKVVGAEPAVELTVGDAADPPLEPGSADVVLCRHVLWALPDPAAVLRRWVALLRPGGRLLLVEGRWHTDAGLTAADTTALLREAGREADVVVLDDPGYWGGRITDERYLAVSLR